MIKQIIVLALVVVAVSADPEHEDVSDGLRKHMKDLTRVAADAYEQAKPTLKEIGGDLSNHLDKVKNSEPVRTLHQHYEKTKNDPRVQRGLGKISEGLQKIEKDPRLQKPLAAIKPGWDALSSAKDRMTSKIFSSGSRNKEGANDAQE